MFAKMSEIRLSIVDYMKYLEGTENSKCVYEGEHVLNAGHLILAGKTKTTATSLNIIALCLQSSALENEPHKIEGRLKIENERAHIELMVCSCKAGQSGRCKHISAFLIKCTREDIKSLENISQTQLKCAWSTQKLITREKYKPVPVKEMPCLANKVPSCNIEINNSEVLNFFCANLPQSAISKHRYVRSFIFCRF